MAVKNLVYDDASPMRGFVSVAATFKNGDILTIPYDHKFLYVGAVKASTVTFGVNAMFGASAIAIKADLDGNSYPRASYTGGLACFNVPPGRALQVNCTAAAKSLWAMSAK